MLQARGLTQAGFRHGFSTRCGGVSLSPFDSLNLARSVGDAPEAVLENHRRLARAVGYEAEQLFEVSQVHGATVLEAAANSSPVELRKREADALFSTTRDQAIGVRVADCVPVLLADPGTGAVAAIHAGWRGLVAGVIESACRALSAQSGAPGSRLLAAVGPHIGPARFEIGEEVAEQLRRVSAEAVLTQGQAKPHADLGWCARRQLERAGLRAEHIEQIQGCTHADAAQFFSYRRDGARSGRHLAVIVAGC